MPVEPEVDDYMSLNMWTVYDHPLDFPQEIVARKTVLNRYGPVPTDDIVTGSTIDEVRAQLPPGLAMVTRSPDDDPKIVEVWF